MVRSRSILFIMFIWLAVFLSGCIVDKNMPEPANTTLNITGTATPSMTPLQESITTGILVKLDGIIGFIPNIKTIKVGDEVVWENFDPVNVILASNDGLFDARLMAFYEQYRYVFSKPGNYTFSLKNTNNTGTIIVESPKIVESPVIIENTTIEETLAIQTPTPSATSLEKLPSYALHVTARMKKLSDWTIGNQTKYGLDAFNVVIKNQINIPLTIKAQVMSSDQILEEKTLTLEKQGSSVEFSNEKKYYINNTNVNLRILIEGYPPIEHKFMEVDQLK